MADQIELEMGDLLQQAVDYAFKEAEERLSNGDELMPFTVLAEEENLYIETHPGSTIEECVTSAHKTIGIASDAITAYVFCYDGYAELDDGTHDAVIVECAERGEENGMVLCKLYESGEDGKAQFDETEYFLDTMPPYFGEPRGTGDGEAKDSGDAEGASSSESDGAGTDAEADADETDTDDADDADDDADDADDGNDI